MITLINTTDRPLNNNTNLIIHNFPFFREVMQEVKPMDVKDAFKSMVATVILVKDMAIAARAHIDNPNADIYVLARNTHCVTLAFKGAKGIEKPVEIKEAYMMCPSEMINFK